MGRALHKTNGQSKQLLFANLSFKSVRHHLILATTMAAAASRTWRKTAPTATAVIRLGWFDPEINVLHLM